LLQVNHHTYRYRRKKLRTDKWASIKTHAHFQRVGSGLNFNSRVIAMLGLVLEGGAMRAGFAAGALMALMDKKLADFDAAAAVSASVPTLAYFAAGQRKEMEKIWRDELTSPKLVCYQKLNKKFYNEKHLDEQTLTQMDIIHTMKFLIKVYITCCFWRSIFSAMRWRWPAAA